KGAFYKEGLGEIDLVWGDENFGLKHILEQRAKQWGEEKALKFISHLSENIEKGQIVELEKGRVGIKTDLTTIILDKKENNNFVLTAFRDRNNKKELESLNLSQSKTFTSENAETNAKESPVTPLNQDSIARRRTDLPSSQSEAEKTTSANASEDIIAQKALMQRESPVLNDEPLEASLENPVKFLEFQQRKLLTYIKQNTPLRLLEHKSELKTRELLNFLEQSALNGKEKAFLMRHLERDLQKIKAEIKGKESDLLDKTKPLRKAEKEELTSEVLEEAKKQNAKIWVGNLENESLADELGLDFQKGVKITMNGNALKHIENRHGVNSTLAKNGQPIVENEDYANHAKIVNEADKRKIILSEDNQKILVSGKQINGYHIIIESISTKDNELKLKTMYKENGSLENSNIFKEPVRDRKSGGESLRVNPSNALDPNGLNKSIAQNT
ncbi:hypothetical protein V6N98_001773, partial [Campylobacter upsaliensis]